MKQALKLSDDLHLNEIDCVHLLVSANQEVSIDLRILRILLISLVSVSVPFPNLSILICFFLMHDYCFCLLHFPSLFHADRSISQS